MKFVYLVSGIMFHERLSVTSEPITVRDGFRLVARYLGPERRDLRALLLFSLLAGALSLVFPLTAQVLMNQVASGAVLQSLTVLALLLFAGLIVFTWLEAARIALVEFIGRRLFVRRAMAFAAQLAHADDATQGPRQRIELTNRFFDVVTADKTLQVLLVDGISTVLSATAGMALLAVYHPALLGFDVLLVVAVALPLLWMPAGLRAAYRESSAKYRVVAWLENIAASSTWPRARGGHEVAHQRITELVEDWLKHRSAHFRVTFRQYVSYLFVQAFGTVGLLTLGGLLVIDGQLSLGQLVAAELVVSATVAAVARFGKLLPKLYDLLVALKKVDAVEAELPQETGGRGRLGTKSALEVTLDEVVLHPGDDAVSLQLDAGKLYARRPSGHAYALLDLLFGLRSPTSGRALFEKLPLQDVAVSELRDRIGYVDGGDLVEGTVEENLRIANPQAEPEEMWSYLDQVGLRNRILALGQGVAAEVSQLNADEQVQLTVARELMRRPDLLLVRGIDLLPGHCLQHVSSALQASSATRLIVTNHVDKFASPPAAEPTARSTS